MNQCISDGNRFSDPSAEGPAGPPGTNGAATVTYFAPRTDQTEIPGGNISIDLVSVTVPAGTYYISGNVNVYSPSNGNIINCTVANFAGILTSSLAGLGPANFAQVVILSTVTLTGADTITLACSSLNQDLYTNVVNNTSPAYSLTVRQDMIILQ